MKKHANLSRASRHDSRRNNNKILAFIIMLAVIFVIILGLLIAYGNKEKPVKPVEDQNNQTEQMSDSDENESGNINDQNDDTNENNEIEENETNQPEYDNLESYKMDAPDLDSNVLAVYVGNWPPIGTTQTGDHVTVYDNHSDDRIEIKTASSMVTGIAEDDMVEWFVGNGGDHQTAIATISDKAETVYYKVYLSWIDEQGWQVTKVEKIKNKN